MTDGHPGWFKDPSDPALARWHDGEDWTEHTLVIAEQTPGIEPSPPVIEAAAADVYFPRHRPDGSSGRPSDDDDERSVPGWAKVVAPIALVLVGVFGFSFISGGDDDPDQADTVDTRPADLDEAVDAARDAGLPSAISDARAAALIERICGAAERPADAPRLGTDLGQLPVTSNSELRTAVAALGEGAEERCADDMADAPELIDDLQDQAFAAFGTTTTSPTVTGDTVPTEGTEGTEGTDDGSGTTVPGRTTGTTRKPTTATTRAPAASTTTTTIKSKIQPGQACSSEGATATDFVGRPVTCVKKGCLPTAKSFVWRSSACSPPVTPPPTDPNAPPPTQPTTTTTTVTDPE
jgi:hypothetical protein